MLVSRPISTGALVVADAALLAELWPDVPATWRGLTAPHRWLAETGTDHVLAVLAGTALWGVAAWVAVGLLAVVLARLPGSTGAAATAVAHRALPAVLRRVVIGSAGLGVLLSPVAPLAAGAQPPPDAPGGRPAVTADPLPGPSWPGSGSAPAPSSPSSPLLPGPSWPGSVRPQHHVPPVAKTPTPARTSPSATPTPTPTRTSPSPRSTPERHPAPTPATGRATVRAGDCLRLLAAHRVGPHASDAEVAAYLPELYAANRRVIGADPDLVRPGQVLDLPAITPQESR